MKLEHFLIPYTNANTKWIKARHVMPETIKLLEQNTEHSLPSVLAIYVLICLLRKRKQKQEWSSGNLLSIKLSYSWKQTNKMLTKQRQPAEWEKIFANDITSKALISKIFILSSINSICKTKTTQKKKRQKISHLLAWLSALKTNLFSPTNLGISYFGFPVGQSRRTWSSNSWENDLQISWHANNSSNSRT